MKKTGSVPQCLDVKSWRKYTKEEMLAYLDKIKSRSGNKKKGTSKKCSVLSVRQNISPIDMYCYLKARFGEPNGFQNFLRKNDSDNWIHWDFNLKAGKEYVYICGMSREIHFTLSESLSDKDWLVLIANIKSDFARIAKEKSAVLKTLEKWVVFPNKFVEIANICSELHNDIIDNMDGYSHYKTASSKTKKGMSEQQKVLENLGKRATKLYKSCLELSLITPVLAESFINMAILMLCKDDIKNNKTQLDAFIRSHIHIKIFDMFYKCEGFVKQVDPGSDTYKKFKRVVDKRNNLIHGNVDPVKEQLETVYFEGTRPLFKDSGDHIGKMFEVLENQHKPQEILEDY